MADALISPAVGGVMWATSAGLAAYSARRLQRDFGGAEYRAPLMGVLGAFVFAAQMINFAIPCTGSSGHLGGGMILAILLGPHAAFIVMFSILTVQALFFADGGLLALGCNVFNMGFWPCFVVYPLVFRKLVGARPGPGRLTTVAVLSGVLSLQLGALGVVLQTLLSGRSELPFGVFLLAMQPIHLAIGIVEGAVTAALMAFIWRARPEIMVSGAASPLGQSFRQDSARTASPAAVPVPVRAMLAGLAVAALLAGGVLSWFASAHPDGLEWSMTKVSGREELAAPSGGLHESLAGIQERTAFLPDYGFRESEREAIALEAKAGPVVGEMRDDEPWPAVSAGTSISGLVGGAMVLVLAAALGMSLRLARRPG